MPQTTAEARSPEACVLTTQSSRLWGLDWSVETPWTFDGITVETCTFEEAIPFVERHYGGIFGAAFQGRFLDDPMTEAKRRFGIDMDVFIYRDGEREIGMLAGHPSDWTSYYMRTVALLPEYRDKHLLSRTMEKLEGPLADAGCDRIDGEVAPTNVAMVRMLTSLGWIVTSTMNSERWGSLLRFTRFLRPEAEEVFARQFCGMRVKAMKAFEAPLDTPRKETTVKKFATASL